MRYLTFIILAALLSGCSFESEEQTLGDNFFSGNKPSENAIVLTPPTSKIYIENESILFKVSHPAVLIVTGSPRLVLDINGATAYANFSSGGNSKTLTFEYIVPAGVEDLSGVEIVGDIDLNGGTITFINKGVVDNSSITIGTTLFANVKIDSIIPTVTLVVPIILPNSTIYVDQAIEMAVTFSEDIIITGSPTIEIDIEGTPKQLQYVSGSGSSNLFFRAFVESTDYDITGYEFTSINLNGGTIRDAGTNAADLSAAVTFNTFVYINGDQPWVQEVIPPANNTYKPGEVLTLSLKFSEAVDVVGSPNIVIDFESGSILANFASGSGTDTLVFSYIVLSGNFDTDGVVIQNTINLNGGSIRDTTNINSILDISPPSTPNVLIDGDIPKVVSIALPSNGTYTTGQELLFTLTFSENILISGTPRMKISLDSSSPGFVYADYSSGSGTQNIIMRYVVGASDVDPNGITLDASLDLNGGSIQNLSASITASTDLTTPIGLINSSGIIISNSDIIAPTITAFTPPLDDNYIIGEAVAFSVTFSENVFVDNFPGVGIDIGTNEIAQYVSGSGTTVLNFEYIVKAADVDFDGVLLIGTALNLNSTGVIRDGSFNNADLDFSTYLPIDLTNVFINVSNVTLLSVTPPANKFYIQGETIDFIFNFTGNVTINGAVQIEGDIAGATVNYNYLSGSGTTSLTFRYTVPAGVEDLDGITVITPLDLNGGNIKDSLGLYWEPEFIVPDTSSVFVDSINPILTIISPQNAIFNNYTTYSLNGVCSETGNTVNVDFGSLSNSAVCSAGTWSIASWNVSGEPDSASVTITATILDNAGNNFSTNTNVMKDIIVPTVSISSPLDSAIINSTDDSSTYAISGNCSEVSQVVNIQFDTVDASSQSSLTCNGTTFSGTVSTLPLAQGAHTLTAIISDVAGNEVTSSTINLTKDSIIPTISITTPATSSFINIANDSAAFAVNGNCSESGQIVDLLIDGVSAPSQVGFNCNGTSFSGTFSSTSLGQTTFSFTAQIDDINGNSATSAANSVSKDTTAPNVAITTPANSTVINATADSASYSVSGTCDESGVTVTIQVDGANASSPVALACNGTNFGGTISTLPISEGAHIFTAIITDSAGNETTSGSINITKATTLPTVAMSSPITSSFINIANSISTFPVSGTCDTAGQTVDIQINGSSAGSQVGLNCNGTNFSGTIDVTSLAQGAHSLTADLTDTNGNLGTSSAVSVTKDTIAPTISSVTTANSGILETGDLLTYTLSLSESVSITSGVRVSITIGASSLFSTCSAVTSTSTTCSYSIQGADYDNDGINTNSPLQLNGGNITDTAGNPISVLTFSTPNTSGITVNNGLPLFEWYDNTLTLITSYDYGQVSNPASVSVNFTVKNIGTTSTSASFAVSLGTSFACNRFSIGTDNCSGNSIPINGSCTVQITYSPFVPLGPDNCTASVKDTGFAPDQNLNLSLTGESN